MHYLHGGEEGEKSLFLMKRWSRTSGGIHALYTIIHTSSTTRILLVLLRCHQSSAITCHQSWAFLQEVAQQWYINSVLIFKQTNACAFSSDGVCVALGARRSLGR